MRNLLPKSLLLPLTLLLTIPAADTAFSSDQLKTLWVAHRRVDCIGVAPQKCYLIKETQYEDWKFWYGDIEGFDYQEGYAYEILVREHRIENPPADAPAIELELVEINLKVETETGIIPSLPRATSPPEDMDTEPEIPTARETRPAPEVPAEPEAPAAPVTSPAPTTPPRPETAAPPVVAPVPAEPVATDESDSISPQHRGHLTIGSGIETRSFKLCGADESIWVEDRTGGELWATYRDLAGLPGRPVYMVVRGRLTAPPASGFGSHYGQQLLIEELRHAATESAGCFDDLGSFAYRASGNEPFWGLEISRRGLLLTEMATDSKTLFPYSPPTFIGDRTIYRSQSGGERPRTLVVRLESAICNDTMADNRYSLEAVVEIDGRTLEGCAVEGEAEP